MNAVTRTRAAALAAAVALTAALAACAPTPPVDPTTTTTTTAPAPAHISITITSGPSFGQVTVTPSASPALVCGGSSLGCSGDVPAGETITYSAAAFFPAQICDPLFVTVDGVETTAYPLTLTAGADVQILVGFQTLCT